VTRRKAHYAGDYEARARAVREAAYANPSTICWRCGKTLPEHGPTRTGKQQHWQAGHLIDGDPTSPLLPEASSCNAAAGVARLNRRRSTGYSWPP